MSCNLLIVAEILPDEHGGNALRLLHTLERAVRKYGLNETELWYRNTISRRFRHLFILPGLLIHIFKAPKPWKQKLQAADAALQLSLEPHKDWRC